MKSMIKKCPSCESLFLDSNGKYQYCRFCHSDYVKQKNIEKQKIEDAKWFKQKEEERRIFERKIRSWNVVEVKDILSAVDTPLYIIGNGFDLLHGAKTSYRDFANNLGKNGQLRCYLETYLDVDDPWSDFEEALGHLNIEMMMSNNIIDMWLDDFNAYNEDASAADFYAAAESAANPAITIADELQRKFRAWIESVAIPTLDRPLSGLIKDAPVLCFNYTEFIEDLYGVDHNNVCYIHGCRKKIKGKPKDKLVLGHIPGANDVEYEFEDKWKPRSHYKRQMIEYAREVVLQHISDCDEELTKYSKEIIRNHYDFFDRLKNITDVIVIGHSLAEVDWNYFNEICRNSNSDDLNWYFSCYGLRDLSNIQRFVEKFSIKLDRFHLFCLDGIKVNIEPLKSEKKVTISQERTLCSSDRWSVRELKGRLNIYDGKENCYSLIFPGIIRKGILFGRYLMVFSEETYLFRYEEGDDGNWGFVGELETMQNQSLINARLDRILYRNDELVFIYNNRIRTYSLKDGRLIGNKAKKNAREMNGLGESLAFR